MKTGRPKDSKNKVSNKVTKKPVDTKVSTGYFAFRLAHDASGKWRIWTEKDEFYGSFNHAEDDTKLNAMRQLCHDMGIPVYYFGVCVDSLDEAELLNIGDSLDNYTW